MSHQTPTASTLVVGAEVVENTKDRGQLEQRLREFTGHPDARVIEVRKVVGKDGKITGYEVDIR